MTWEPVKFSTRTATGRPGAGIVRIGVGRQEGSLHMMIVLPGDVADELGWRGKDMLAMALGRGEHDGWIRLAPSSAEHGRRLRTTTKSRNLRWVSMLWPWLQGRVTDVRSLSQTDHRIGPRVTTGSGSRAMFALDVCLPAWAAPAVEAAADCDVDKPRLLGDAIMEAKRKAEREHVEKMRRMSQEAQQRAGDVAARPVPTRLADMPHPLPPNVPPRGSKDAARVGG